jgi:hypothetical protein
MKRIYAVIGAKRGHPKGKSAMMSEPTFRKIVFLSDKPSPGSETICQEYQTFPNLL